MKQLLRYPKKDCSQKEENEKKYAKSVLRKKPFFVFARQPNIIYYSPFIPRSFAVPS